MTKRPTTATAVLHESKAVTFDGYIPHRITNASMNKGSYSQVEAHRNSAQRPGCMDAYALLSRTSFSDSPAKGELPAPALIVPDSQARQV